MLYDFPAFHQHQVVVDEIEDLAALLVGVTADDDEDLQLPKNVVDHREQERALLTARQVQTGEDVACAPTILPIAKIKHLLGKLMRAGRPQVIESSRRVSSY